jgi:hypothetical protein
MWYLCLQVCVSACDSVQCDVAAASASARIVVFCMGRSVAQAVVEVVLLQRVRKSVGLCVVFGPLRIWQSVLFCAC